MTKKTLEACRKGKEFVDLSIARGADVRNGCGSHFVVSTPKGQCVIPVHNGDLGKGLRCKIIKTLALILAVILITIFLIACTGA